MTRYEELKTKADRCKTAAGRTNGRMREIWLDHAARLELMLSTLTIKEASRGAK